MVKIETLNTDGILQPKESHSVIVKVTTLCEPAILSLNLICEFFDLTQDSLYRQSQMDDVSKREQMSQTFFITEEGKEIPVLYPQIYKLFSWKYCIISDEAAF